MPMRRMTVEQNCSIIGFDQWRRPVCSTAGESRWVADLGLGAAATIPADQMHRTHLGRLSAFRAQIVRVDDLVT